MQFAEINVQEEEFLGIRDGRQKFLLAKDNGHQAGDCLLLKQLGKDGSGTGNAKTVKVSCAKRTRDGLSDGYCILGLE